MEAVVEDVIEQDDAADPDAAAEPLEVVPCHLGRVIAVDVAWVTCTENVLSQVGGRVSVTSLLATNIFERVPGGWRMVHHQASRNVSREMRHRRDAFPAGT